MIHLTGGIQLKQSIKQQPHQFIRPWQSLHVAEDKNAFTEIQ